MDYTTADAIKEMMAVWAKIEAAAKAQFPNESEEERYQICKAAMQIALSTKRGS